MAVLCLYGQPGSGKTVNSTRLPGKTLLISSDNSALVLKNFDRPKLTVKPASNFKEFVDRFEEAVKNKQYDNIIVDCLTDLIDAYIADNPVYWVYCDLVNASKDAVAAASPMNALIDTISHGLSCSEEPAETPDLAHYDSMSEIKLGHLFAEEAAKFFD